MSDVNFSYLQKKKKTKKQQMEHEKNNAGMQPDKSNLLASRMVERALGYSWVKFGWETATKTYNTVKSSNRLTKV